MAMLPAGYKIPVSKYQFSNSITIREWNHGSGVLRVGIGFVTEHPDQNSIVLVKEIKRANGFWETTSQFYLPTDRYEDWVCIKNAVEKLWPEVAGKSSAAEFEEAIGKVEGDFKLLALLAKYPGLLKAIPADLDIMALPQEEREALLNFIGTGGDVSIKILEKLAQESPADLEEFKKLLEGYRLSTTNALLTHIIGRLSFIDTFEKLVLDDSVYERRGIGSVHNTLLAGIWMVDHRFVILHDDETLKKVIYKQTGFEMNTPEYERRPDFLCLIDDEPSASTRQLVILEIKRPSYAVKFSDLEQIFFYADVVKKFFPNSQWKVKKYLIGGKFEDLIRTAELDRSETYIWTYSELVEQARKFYREYRKIWEKHKEII